MILHDHLISNDNSIHSHYSFLRWCYFVGMYTEGLVLKKKVLTNTTGAL